MNLKIDATLTNKDTKVQQYHLLKFTIYYLSVILYGISD